MKKIILFLITLIVSSIFLVSCQPKVSDQEFKIGAILPLTGPLGYLGEEEKKAIELAVEDINRDKKIVSVIFEDSKGKPSEAATVANKLIDIDGVDALITSTTSVSRAVLPIADRNKKLIAGLFMDPTIQKDSIYAFRLYESMGQEAEVLLNYYATKDNKNKKIGVLYINHAGTVQQLENYFIPGFKKMGANVVYQEPYELTEKDFRVKINKIRKLNVDSLIIIGFGFEYLPIFEQLAQHGLIGKIEITGGWGFIAPNKVPSELLENIIVASPRYVFSKNKKALDFEKNYKEKFGNIPNFDAAFAYDAVGIIVDGLIKADGKTDKVLSVLAKQEKYHGIMGESNIDDAGGLSVPMGLGIIKSGKIMPLGK